MSKTPRTDKKEFIVYPQTRAETYAVESSFARRLELEILELKDKLNEQEDLLNSWRFFAIRLQDEIKTIDAIKRRPHILNS